VPDAGVQDGGDVAGSDQVPFGDRLGQDTGGVQAGQFGGAQGAPGWFLGCTQFRVTGCRHAWTIDGRRLPRN